jgi:hypothetical protein
MRRKRPRNHRAAEKRDEPAPPHVLSQGPRTHPTQDGVSQLEALWPNSSAPGRATEWSVPPTRNNRIMGADFLAQCRVLKVVRTLRMGRGNGR